MDDRFSKTAELFKKLEDSVLTAFVGDRKPVRLAVLSLMASLHALVEDIPGVGKTTLALALARSGGLEFSRIQFTPDLLPGDVLGLSVWDSVQREFVYKKGPIMANFVLADEMNRASPRTQSAFLEALQEGSVTVDGNTRPLPRPFFLMATQNPLNFIGTFPLPEAELDRFGLSFSIGYPTPSAETEILRRWTVSSLAETITPVTDSGEISASRRVVEAVRVSEAVREYIVSIIRATRQSGDLKIGASPRGGAFLQQAARAVALMEGRAFVIPEDVEFVAPAVLSHRLVLSSQARLAGRDSSSVLRDILSSIKKPTGL